MQVLELRRVGKENRNSPTATSAVNHISKDAVNTLVVCTETQPQRRNISRLHRQKRVKNLNGILSGEAASQGKVNVQDHHASTYQQPSTPECQCPARAIQIEYCPARIPKSGQRT